METRPNCSLHEVGSNGTSIGLLKHKLVADATALLPCKHRSQKTVCQPTNFIFLIDIDLFQGTVFCKIGPEDVKS